MSFIQNASIRTKILSIILPLCVIGIAGDAIIAHSYDASAQSYAGFISKDVRAEENMAIASQRLAAVAYDAYKVLAYDANTADMKAAVDDYAASKDRFLKLLDETQSKLPHEKETLQGFSTAATAIFATTDKAVQAGEADKNDEAKALLVDADRRISETLPRMREWINSSSEGIVARSEELNRQASETIFYSIASVAAMFAVGIGLALLLTRSGITSPIAALRGRMLSLAEGDTNSEVFGLHRRDEVGAMAKAVAVFRDNALERQRLEEETIANRSVSEQERIEREAQKARDAADTQIAVDGLAAGLQALSDGNVAYRIATPFVPHLERLRENFNASLEKLEATLAQVGKNARGIDAGANEIRSAADDLSRRTEQQAASVEETAAALEQITIAVKDSARRAEDAGALVARARNGAENSSEVVRNAVSAMQSIKTSSTEIANIIVVIDEIAFQTNLLALNAGVEAARAGEAGKGFAVVAQEVRELAQRSATAAKQIKGLIQASGNHVKAGVTLVGQTGVALEAIAAEVREINQHVSAIVEASREQSTGLQEINVAVNTMDQGTQQNAAMVEQSTAASHGLAKEAASLMEMLSQFKLSEPLESQVSRLRETGRAMATSLPQAISNAPRRQLAAAGSSNAGCTEF